MYGDVGPQFDLLDAFTIWASVSLAVRPCSAMIPSWRPIASTVAVICFTVSLVAFTRETVNHFAMTPVAIAPMAGARALSHAPPNDDGNADAERSYDQAEFPTTSLVALRVLLHRAVDRLCHRPLHAEEGQIRFTPSISWWVIEKAGVTPLPKVDPDVSSIL